MFGSDVLDTFRTISGAARLPPSDIFLQKEILHLRNSFLQENKKKKPDLTMM